jgi:hypothetical protein
VCRQGLCGVYVDATSGICAFLAEGQSETSTMIPVMDGSTADAQIAYMIQQSPKPKEYKFRTDCNRHIRP